MQHLSLDLCRKEEFDKILERLSALSMNLDEVISACVVGLDLEALGNDTPDSDDAIGIVDESPTR